MNKNVSNFKLKTHSLLNYICFCLMHKQYSDIPINDIEEVVAELELEIYGGGYYSNKLKRKKKKSINN